MFCGVFRKYVAEPFRAKQLDIANLSAAMRGPCRGCGRALGDVVRPWRKRRWHQHRAPAMLPMAPLSEGGLVFAIRIHETGPTSFFFIRSPVRASAKLTFVFFASRELSTLSADHSRFGICAKHWLEKSPCKMPIGQILLPHSTLRSICLNPASMRNPARPHGRHLRSRRVRRP
jgi:hypothetical protein